MPESSAPVLVAKDVSKVFASQVALDGLSLDMLPGPGARAARRERLREIHVHQDPCRATTRPSRGSSITVAGKPH